MKKWKINKKTNSFSTNIFAIDCLGCFHPEKEICHDFYRIKSTDWVNVVVQTKNQQFIFVKQHRLGTDEVTTETIGGIIDPGEKPIEAARRELIEETGFDCEEMIPLKDLKVNPAIFNNKIHYFFAKNCFQIADQNLDREEDIDLAFYSEKQMFELIKNESIDHSLIVLALLLYKEKAL